MQREVCFKKEPRYQDVCEGPRRRRLSETELPEKCRRCAKSKAFSASEGCDFCAETGFPESILCDLNRSVQGPGDFSCHAFLFILKSAALVPVGPRRTKAPGRTEKGQRAEGFQGVMLSEKFKYEKA